MRAASKLLEHGCCNNFPSVKFLAELGTSAGRDGSELSGKNAVGICLLGVKYIFITEENVQFSYNNTVCILASH